jgi:hypothetical protein
MRVAEADVRRLVASQLRPTWEDVWHGVDLLRTLPEGAHVAERWKRDRWSFTGHRDRLRAGEPPQPRRDDAVTAAQKLAGRETAQARLYAQEALDDPLVMAGRRLAGEAFSGTVREVEMAYSEGRRPMPRPLVTLTTADFPQAEPGTRAFRALPDAKSAQTADLVAVTPAHPVPSPRPEPDASPAGTPSPGAGPAYVPSPAPAPAAPDRGPAATAPAPGPAEWLVTVRLTGGMGAGRTPREGSVPAPGDRVTFTLFAHDPRGGPALPDPEATPWTHGGPPGQAAQQGLPAEAPDTVTAEDFL